MRYGFAHRGGAPGPNNTLTAFAAALKLGVNALETDAWLSADGAVILDHDGRVRPGGGKPIAEVRRDELPAHMPTLDELYESCGVDYQLAIDVKSAAAATVILDVARRHGALDHLWLVSGGPTGLAHLDLGGAHATVTLRGSVLRSKAGRAGLVQASEAGVEAINARWPWWTASLVDRVHALGMVAFGYDAQSSRALRRTVSLGLDGVFSDHVDRMLAVLRQTETM